MNKEYLNVVEIYETIDGEINAFHQGRMTTIIRLAGCNLQCSYCDSLYACQSEGIRMSIDDVLLELEKIGNKSITITGGEPLLQGEALLDLFRTMEWKMMSSLDRYEINIETNGTIDPLSFRFHDYCDSITTTMDYKLPSSRIKIDKIDLDHFHYVSVIKFLIADVFDYTHALHVKKMLENNNCKSLFAFSTINFLNEKEKERFTKRTNIKEVWSTKQLYERLRGDKQYENVILNVQIHKLIGLK